MKTTMRCPKCGHNRILYISEVADGAGSAGSNAVSSRAAKLARSVSKTGSFLGMDVQKVESWGDLEAGCCRRCGYVELYVKDPESIPVDGQYVREIVGPE